MEHLIVPRCAMWDAGKEWWTGQTDRAQDRQGSLRGTKGRGMASVLDQRSVRWRPEAGKGLTDPANCQEESVFLEGSQAQTRQVSS